jgi:hypothetical protein
MSDKEILERIQMAYRSYPCPNKDIENFIQWVYKQYGIVHPNKEKK